MENIELVKKQAKKAAYAVGWVTFLGFSVVLFLPSIYANPFTGLFLAVYLVPLPIGVLVAYLSGVVTYFIFKNLIRNKIAYFLVLVILSIAGFIVGISSFAIMVRRLSRTPPYTNKVDTNRDGKIDKWVYHDDMSTTVEIDTDYDGKPDIREYYKNGELIKKEQVSVIQQK